MASEGLCEGKRTLLHSACDNRCFVREGQDKKQGVGGEIIIGKGLAFGACRCWKEDDLLLQCPRWHLATFPEPGRGGGAGGGSAAPLAPSPPRAGHRGRGPGREPPWGRGHGAGQAWRSRVPPSPAGHRHGLLKPRPQKGPAKKKKKRGARVTYKLLAPRIEKRDGFVLRITGPG